MKRLLFLLMLAPMFSFTNPAASTEHDWVYELNKPNIKPTATLTIDYCHYQQPCDGQVNIRVTTNEAVSYERYFNVTIQWGNGLYSVIRGFYSPNTTQWYGFVFTTSYDCAVGIVSYSVAWYND